MRTLFFLVFFLWGTFIQAKKVTFKGEIANPFELNVDLGFSRNDLDVDNVVIKATLNEHNKFAMVFDVGAAKWVTITHGTDTFKAFIAEGEDEVDFFFSAGNSTATLVFRGSHSSTNNFIANFNRIYRPNPEMEVYKKGGLQTFIPKDIANKAKTYAIYDYFKNLETNYYAQQRYLHNTVNLNRDFFRYFDTFLNWNYETNKLAYFLLNKDRISPQDLRNYWGRYAVLQTVILNEDKDVKYPAFQNLLTAFTHYLALELPSDPRDEDLAYYQFVEGNLSGKARNFMLAKVMLGFYQLDSNPRLAQLKYKGYKRENTHIEYNQTLESIFGGDLKFVPKQEVPNFKVMQVDNADAYLTDYSGKVVYISFWASWCGPCLQGFRETYQVRKELERKGIVLLNINLDKSESLWRGALSRNDIPGTNVFALDMSKLNQEIKVSSLPHYLLVNKWGKLTYLSTKDLNQSVEEFTALMNE